MTIGPLKAAAVRDIMSSHHKLIKIIINVLGLYYSGAYKQEHLNPRDDDNPLNC
jgi:hypothetical protein